MFTRRLAVLIVFCCTQLASFAGAQPNTPPRVARFPTDKLSLLPSPDNQWTLINECSQCPDGERLLWIRNNSNSRRRLVRKYDRTVQVGWAPDSSHFLLNDELVSDKTAAYVLDPRTLKAIELEKLLVATDPDAPKFIHAGHAYVAAQHWLTSHELLVTLSGHFDLMPANEFDLRYRVKLDGTVLKVSERQWNPDTGKLVQ